MPKCLLFLLNEIARKVPWVLNCYLYYFIVFCSNFRLNDLLYYLNDNKFPYYLTTQWRTSRILLWSTRSGATKEGATLGTHKLQKTIGGIKKCYVRLKNTKAQLGIKYYFGPTFSGINKRQTSKKIKEIKVVCNMNW